VAVNNGSTIGNEFSGGGALGSRYRGSISGVTSSGSLTTTHKLYETPVSMFYYTPGSADTFKLSTIAQPSTGLLVTSPGSLNVGLFISNRVSTGKGLAIELL
jgi:hypothetical protein